MNSYELVLIAQGDLEGEAQTSIVQNYHSLIEGLGGEVVQIETWGKRRLAYPIRKLQEGYYYVTQVQIQPEALPEMERSLKLTEPIIRYMVIRQED